MLKTAKVFDIFSSKKYNVKIPIHNELADAVVDQFTTEE